MEFRKLREVFFQPVSSDRFATPLPTIQVQVYDFPIVDLLFGKTALDRHILLRFQNTANKGDGYHNLLRVVWAQVH
jgi:hypothetical protein